MQRKLLPFLLVAFVLPAFAWADDVDYNPPPTYYSSATGTGSTLKSQLTSIMSSGQIQRSYGDFHYSAVIHDADPAYPGNILLAYNRASVSGSWDSGVTWNREHVWPQSRQPGDASNSSRGNLGDPHALRPIDPGINSSRSNKPYGFEDSSGGYGAVASGYYFPGDVDKGDIARQLFYSDTRYGSTGLTLVDSTPSGYQMGDLSSLVAWNYLDVPDDFERHRNQAIFSSGLNPSYYTANRNAYIDRPEYVWSVYVDQENDSQLYVGSAPDSDGGSSLALDFGTVFTGSSVPSQAVSLHKNGNDGSYFEVSTTGGATSSIDGRYNAFAINTTGSDMKSMDVGFSPATTSSAGFATEQIVIDNLDVTELGGAGRGANDANDVIDMGLTVVDRSEASFAASGDVDSLLVDLGTIVQGSGDALAQIDVHNLEVTAGFTASLDLLASAALGDTAALSIDLPVGNQLTGILAGGFGTLNATLDDNGVGAFSATYEFRPFDDQDIADYVEGAMLTLQLVGEVVAVPEPASCILLFCGVLSLDQLRRRKIR